MSNIVSVRDPLLEFAMESPAVPVVSVPAPAQTLIQPQDPAVDATSRAVSFAIGFAMASVLAWVGNVPAVSVSSQTVVASKAVSVASAVGSVVTPATPEPARLVPALAGNATAPLAVPDTTTTSQPERPPALYAISEQPARRRSAVSGYRGALVLSSTPDGAEVLLNGAVVGRTPVVLSNLPVGSRTLVVRRDGYEPWSTSVRIVANQRTPVRATLKPADHRGG